MRLKLETRKWISENLVTKFTLLHLWDKSWENMWGSNDQGAISFFLFSITKYWNTFIITLLYTSCLQGREEVLCLALRHYFNFTVLWGRYNYYIHFIDTGTEAWWVQELSEVPQPINSKARIGAQPQGLCFFYYTTLLDYRHHLFDSRILHQGMSNRRPLRDCSRAVP